jgi:tetratricopeptide (TPR) repeat protein
METRVATIVAHVAPLSGDERLRAVRVACGDDETLLEQVLAEIERSTNTDNVTVAVPPNATVPNTERPPDALVPVDFGPRVRKAGPFRIEGNRPLGRGGFGEVWSGMRDEGGFRQRVAIKILTRSLTDEKVVRRFELERQVLASLDHPDIARLIDGGTLEDKRPWLAMEFVEGVSITHFCDRERLTVENRIRLFQRVAMAVQHAHENLVIHRDIKPDNVLVTADGGPKLLDFGIAKIVNPELGGVSTQVTQVGEGVMTPDYAAPEQFTGEAISVRSDVYSLGVLLYELLTGRLPFINEENKYRELRSAKLEKDPPAPSIALSTLSTDPATHKKICADRDTHVGRLRKRLLGDLDVILLRALKREPSRRYASPREFVQDLQRHLDGLPVEARPDSVAYRTTRFVARHRAGVAVVTSLVVIVALGAITIAALAQQRTTAAEAVAASSRAEVEATRAEMAESARDMYEDLEREVNTLASDDLVEALQEANRLSAARKILESMIQRLTLATKTDPSNPAFKELRIRALMRLARVHYTDQAPSLGDRTIAAHIQSDAREALQQALLDHPLHGGLMAFDAILALDTVDTLPPDERRPILEHALKQVASGEKVDGERIDDQRFIARITNEFADVERKQGNLDEALLLYAKAKSIYEELRELDPINPRRSRDLAITETRIGEALQQQGDLVAARTRFERSLKLRTAIISEASNQRSIKAQRDLARGHKSMADVLYQSKSHSLAKHHLERYLSLTSEVAWLDPFDNRSAKEDLLTAISLTTRLPRLSNGDTSGLIEHNLRFRRQLIEPRLGFLNDPTARELALRVDRTIGMTQFAEAYGEQDPIRQLELGNLAARRLEQAIDVAAPLLEDGIANAGLIAEVGLCHLYLSGAQRLLEESGADTNEVEADRLYRLASEIDANDRTVAKLGRQLAASSEVVRDGS